MTTTKEIDENGRPWWVYFLWVVVILFFVGMIFLRSIIFSFPESTPLLQNVVQDKIDLSDQLSSCTYFKDHIECTLISGITYYAMFDKITAVTKWDCSAWKENPC